MERTKADINRLKAAGIRNEERMERKSGKSSSNAGSDKMERVGDRWGKMERYIVRQAKAHSGL